MNHFTTSNQHQLAQQQAANAIITIKNTIESFQKNANLDQVDIYNLNEATKIVERYDNMIQPISLFGRIMNWFNNTRGHKVSAFEVLGDETYEWLNQIRNLNIAWRQLRVLESDIRNNPPQTDEERSEKLTTYANMINKTFIFLGQIFDRTLILLKTIKDSTIYTSLPPPQLNEYMVASDELIPTTAHNAIIKNIVNHLFNAEFQLQSVEQEEAFIFAIDTLMKSGEIPISQKAPLVSNCLNAVRDSDTKLQIKNEINKVLEGVVVNTRTDESLVSIFDDPAIKSRVVIRRAFNTVVLGANSNISETLNNDSLKGKEDDPEIDCISQKVVGLDDSDYTTAYALLYSPGDNCPQHLKCTLNDIINRNLPLQAKEDLILIWQSYGMAGRGVEVRIINHNSYFKRMMMELNEDPDDARKGSIMRHICRIVCIPDPEEIKERVLCLTNVVAILTRAFDYDSTQDNRRNQWKTVVDKVSRNISGTGSSGTGSSGTGSSDTGSTKQGSSKGSNNGSSNNGMGSSSSSSSSNNDMGNRFMGSNNSNNGSSSSSSSSSSNNDMGNGFMGSTKQDSSMGSNNSNNGSGNSFTGSSSSSSSISNNSSSDDDDFEDDGDNTTTTRSIEEREQGYNDGKYKRQKRERDYGGRRKRKKTRRKLKRKTKKSKIKRKIKRKTKSKIKRKIKSKIKKRKTKKRKTKKRKINKRKTKK